MIKKRRYYFFFLDLQIKKKKVNLNKAIEDASRKKQQVFNDVKIKVHQRINIKNTQD